MSDLAQWLLEQIADQEARAAGDIEHFGESSDPRDRWIEKMARRVLAECEAKRRIIDEHPKTDRYDESIAFCLTCENGHARPGAYPCQTLRLLALPYADRPGYQEEWRP